MINQKKVLAIIPARKNSKRIRNKNIVKFGNKPLINWTIKAAKKSRYIDKIIVSTDCKKIKKIAEKNMIETPFYRKKNKGDFTPVSLATIEAIYQTKKYYGNFDIVVQLMANCPLRKSLHIEGALKNFIKKKYNSQISFFTFPGGNASWSHKLRSSGKGKAIFKKKMKSRSQDLNKSYFPTGAIWISKINTLKKYKTFYSPGFGSYIIDFISSIDIDTMEDLKFAKKFINKNK